ncbi:uncharacterized protein [Pyrus communis]|uniref:uncharacterized protein n=1 Tax=Pyrus communis TaxID=23211 RepID=UPI0035C0414D
MNLIDIQCKVQAWLYEIKKWHRKYSCKKVSTPQKWRKPAAGRMKVNFDGAWDKRHDQGGIGVVVREANGNFVVAMARHVEGIKSPTLAECMAARAAAAFAQRWVGAQVELEGDALLMVVALQWDSVANMGQFGQVLDDTHQLMDNIPQGRASFCTWEANNVAHRLASNSTGFHTAAAVFRGGGALHDGRKMAAEFADQAAKEELEAEFLLGLCW